MAFRPFDKQFRIIRSRTHEDEEDKNEGSPYQPYQNTRSPHEAEQPTMCGARYQDALVIPKPGKTSPLSSLIQTRIWSSSPHYKQQRGTHKRSRTVNDTHFGLPRYMSNNIKATYTNQPSMDVTHAFTIPSPWRKIDSYACLLKRIKQKDEFNEQVVPFSKPHMV
jgi:hypothetical protein